MRRNFFAHRQFDMPSKVELRRLLSYVTCGLWFFNTPQVIKSQKEWSPFILPFKCKCGDTEPGYEYSELLLPYLTRVCIGYITWVPCPVHPCEHSTIDSDYLDEKQCLCSIQAQIDLCPKVKEMQNALIQDRDNIWGSTRFGPLLFKNNRALL